eukprot:gene1527-12653_t
MSIDDYAYYQTLLNWKMYHQDPVFNSIYAFGENSFGHFGFGDTIDRETPTLLEFFNNEKIKQVSSSGQHTLFLTASNKLYACGSNLSNQLGFEGKMREKTPIQLNFFEDEEIDTIEAKGSISLVFTKCNKIYVFGENSADLGATCEYDKPKIFKFDKKIKKLCIGSNHGVILTESNNVYIWHFNWDQIDFLKFKTPKMMDVNGKTVVDIECGSNHTIAVTGNFKNDSSKHKENNEMILWNLDMKPQIFGFFEDKIIKQIACGSQHNLVLTDNDEIYVWGNNASGQLGLSHLNNIFTPTLLKYSFGHSKIMKIFCGGDHSMVLTESFEVYGWGYNLFGQLGNSNH